jgi:hypothetical protein
MRPASPDTIRPDPFRNVSRVFGKHRADKILIFDMGNLGYGVSSLERGMSINGSDLHPCDLGLTTYSLDSSSSSKIFLCGLKFVRQLDMSTHADEKIEIETVENSATPTSEEEVVPVVTTKTWIVVAVSRTPDSSRSYC